MLSKSNIDHISGLLSEASSNIQKSKQILSDLEDKETEQMRMLSEANVNILCNDIRMLLDGCIMETTSLENINSISMNLQKILTKHNVVEFFRFSVVCEGNTLFVSGNNIASMLLLELVKTKTVS